MLDWWWERGIFSTIFPTFLLNSLRPHRRLYFNTRVHDIDTVVFGTTSFVLYYGYSLLTGSPAAAVSV
jgi:hypothetical protein